MFNLSIRLHNHIRCASC